MDPGRLHAKYEGPKSRDNLTKGNVNEYAGKSASQWVSDSSSGGLVEKVCI